MITKPKMKIELMTTTLTITVVTVAVVRMTVMILMKPALRSHRSDMHARKTDKRNVTTVGYGRLYINREGLRRSTEIVSILTLATQLTITAPTTSNPEAKLWRGLRAAYPVGCYMLA